MVHNGSFANHASIRRELIADVAVFDSENDSEVGARFVAAHLPQANFGAFARIEDGIEGLIHVSEIADDRVTHPKQAVKEGQDLLLRTPPQHRVLVLDHGQRLDRVGPADS